MKAEITRIERMGPVNEKILPADFEEIVREQEEKLEQMRTTPWLADDVAWKELGAQFWRDNNLAGGFVIDGGACGGALAQVKNDGTMYRHEQEFVANPGEFKDKHGRWPRVYKIENGTRTTVLVMRGDLRDGLGRAQGSFGWSDDKDLVGMAKEAPWHNYFVRLIGYFERPGLPCRDRIRVPNVSSSRAFPSVLNPPASYKFSGIAPAPVHTYVVEINTPTECEVAFEWWNSNKEKVARTDKKELEKGDNKIVASITGIPSPPMTGFFNIEVFEAPKGLTVRRVGTSPPTSPLGR